MSFYALVSFHNFLRVNWQLFIRINDHTEQAGVCLENEKEREREREQLIDMVIRMEF